MWKPTDEEIKKMQEMMDKQRAETKASGGVDWGQATVEALRRHTTKDMTKEEYIKYLIENNLDSGWWNDELVTNPNK